MTSICLLTAAPRTAPKPLPEFLSPGARPEGSGPALGLRVYTGMLDAALYAQGKAPRLNVAGLLHGIKLAERNRRGLLCLINAAGGAAEDFLAVATALLAHPFAVHCKIVGKCSSGAAFVALAADKRTIVAGGTVLLHTTRRFYSPEQWDAIRALPQADKDGINDSLADVDDTLVAMLRTLLGVTEAVARRWLSEETKWSAAEALARGFVDEIDGEI